MNIIIKLSGRIDTASAPAAEHMIEQKLQEQSATPADKIVLDCSNLEYISSTGLRIILKYKKQHPDLEVINVSNEVYNVFDITGFTRILTVRKALRRISIKGCKEIGRGGVGIIYRYTPDTIIKVFSPECSIEVPERERVMAREAFVLGMPTAIPFDIVWVTDTQSYGLMTELLNARTLGAIINEDQANYKHYAGLFGRMLRNMHQIKVDEGGTLPDTTQVHAADFDRIARHFTPEEVELMRYIISKIPHGNSLLHNDCHPKNIMMCGEPGNEELMLIDMGEVCYGNPLFELLHTCSSFNIEDNFEGILGFPKALSRPFWLETLRVYFDTDDEQFVQQYAEIIDAASIVRSIAWIAVADFPQEVIDGVRKIADERLWNNRDYYIRMAERFKELP